MNTKAINIKNSAWAFKLNANKNPSENIAELLKQLSIKKLRLFTKQSLKKNNRPPPSIQIHSQPAPNGYRTATRTPSRPTKSNGLTPCES